MNLDGLRRVAALGQREGFEKFLQLVPDVPAAAGDIWDVHDNSGPHPVPMQERTLP